MRTLLSPEAIQAALTALPGWHIEDGHLVRTFTFPTFMQTIGFVNAAATLAEQANHHPDLDIRYTLIKVSLVTHDADGITHNDTDMAAKLDRISMTSANME